MILSKRISSIHLLCIGAIIFSLLFIPTLSLFAHSEGGGSFETEVGDYSIDIGYYPERIEVGVPVRLDFETYSKNESDDASFSNVWIRIEKGEKTIFATGVHRPEFGTTGLLYTFGESGTYTIYTRFQNNDETIVETTFPLDVLENSDMLENSLLDSKSDMSFLWGLFGLLAGAVLCFVIIRKGNKKEEEDR